MKTLKARTRLGKYRIDRRLASGGFAEVYRAHDTLEGITVALKIPRIAPDDRQALDTVRREVRLTARMQHDNILTVKNADFMGNQLVIVYPLGERSLADRLTTRMSVATGLAYTEQMLAALSYAHRRKVLHCDVKPENFILFPEDKLRLGDFGIAKMARRTVDASGSGTLGYVAPEQALGRPSFRSDVFSLGLCVWRMFSGRLPRWPFEWPLPGHERMKRNLHPEMLDWLRKALEVDHRKRFADAGQMESAFKRIRHRARGSVNGRRRITKRTTTTKTGTAWREIRHKQFNRLYRKSLGTRFECSGCCGPVSEAMSACPWCGKSRAKHVGETPLPAICRRCNRGMKLDWTYCAWCFGPAYEPLSDKQYSDKRYTARCSNTRCDRRDLMPFMRYCPWCRAKVRKRWKVAGTTSDCPRCHWGVLPEFWDHCPWCAKNLKRK